jgi:hypothetical protein
MDAINDAHQGTGNYAYYIDHFGDAESGDVIFSCNGDMCRCPYEISDTTGASKCTINMDACEDVMPRTIYEPEVDEDDHMAAMAEAIKAKHYGDKTPLYERFVSKKERDSASSKDFAGKGKSFPILKAADVAAAAKALGPAGSGNYSTDVIKRNIIRIAKAKGFTSELPKAWQNDTSETASAKESMHLVESAATCENIVLREAKADYEIKLIAPGKGSSAFYPAEVLRRDGPNVFKSGTHVYLNHQTAAEEAARPEGDVKNLAGVLTTTARYEESHAKGPGLYARMKVFADHAQMVEEKAAHVGMSIRASGVAEASRKQDGLPVLKELTSAESVDVVTRAGAGGMILTEAARGAVNLEKEASQMPMDENELKLLRESVAAVSATNAALLEKELRREAIAHGAATYRDLNIPNQAKEYLITKVLERGLPKKDGALDTAKLTESLNAEAREFGAAIGLQQRVTGMGASGGTQLTEAQRADFEKQQKETQQATEKQYTEAWADLFTSGSPAEKVKLAEVAIRGRAN